MKTRLVLSGRSLVSLAQVLLMSSLVLTATSVLRAVIKNSMSTRQVSLFVGSMKVLYCLKKYLNSKKELFNLNKKRFRFPLKASLNSFNSMTK